jgi:hypothetical protein
MAKVRVAIWVWAMLSTNRSPSRAASSRRHSKNGRDSGMPAREVDPPERAAEERGRTRRPAARRQSSSAGPLPRLGAVEVGRLGRHVGGARHRQGEALAELVAHPRKSSTLSSSGSRAHLAVGLPQRHPPQEGQGDRARPAGQRSPGTSMRSVQPFAIGRNPGSTCTGAGATRICDCPPANRDEVAVAAQVVALRLEPIEGRHWVRPRRSGSVSTASCT